MNDPIYDELSSRIPFPELVTDEIFICDCDTSILRHRGTKQVIKLSSNEVKEILDEKEINLPWFLFKFADGLIESDTSKYYNLDDGYQISEYFSIADTYIPTYDYFRAVKFGNIDMIINIYNGNDCKIPFKQILDKLKIQTKDDISIYENILPFPMINDKIKYTKFDKIVYKKDSHINKYMYKFPSICVNLPYEYYKSQDVPENIFVWDIDKQELCFTNKTIDEIYDIFIDICKNGFTKPLYFQVCHGKITSASDDDYIRLIIAQYLRLPSIPAVIYLLKNSKESDMLISMRPCDIIGAINDTHDTDDNIKILNEVCGPYIICFKDGMSCINPNYRYRPIDLSDDLYNDIYLTHESKNV